MCKSDIHPKIGEVYLMYFSGTGSEQSGWRPGVVFQNNIGNIYSPNVIALPLTTAIKKKDQPTHVLLNSKSCGLKTDSMVLCENPQRMSKKNIGRYITTLSKEVMAEIAAASLLASSAIAYIDRDVLLSIWQKALILNRQASIVNT